MIKDFNHIAESSTDLNFDLCIIGAGVAGITLANKLNGTSFNICILEGGGESFSEESQTLYEGTWNNHLMNGQSSEVPARTFADRLRFFGGTSNHWTGRCRRLDPIDFEKRDWVSNSGWPINSSELDQYYQEAENILEVNTSVEEQTANNTLNIGKDETFKKKDFTFSPPVRMGKKYGSTLKDSQNITLILNANVQELFLDNTSTRINSIDVYNQNGKSTKIKAKRFVLATGGLENVRLLLNSKSSSPSGIGNQNDVVGRYFMGHPILKGGALLISDENFKPDNYLIRKDIDFLQYTNQTINTFHRKVLQKLGQNPEAKFYTDNRKAQSSIALSEQAQRQYQLLNTAFTFNGDFELNENELALAENVLSIRKQLAGKKAHHTILSQSILFRPEQVPNPESRVSLSDTKDKYGYNQIKVDWHLSEADYKAMYKTLTLLSQELTLSQNGLLKIDFAPDSIPETLWTGAHHIGGTRMHLDPTKGVVDKHCKVHGINNLFISGCSVFPTSGFANPTLTLTALALRLSDYLKNN